MTRSYSNDELITLMEAAPLLVQQAIESKTTAKTISGIATSFNLHIDVLGKLAELNVLMLLGLVNPDEFLQELITAGIPEADARTIMTEINEKIFMPLREQMRSGAEKAEQPTRPVAPATPRPTQPVRPPMQVPPTRVSVPAPSYVPPRPPTPVPPIRPAPQPTPRANDFPPPSVIIQANPRLPERPQQQEYISKVPRYVPPPKQSAPPKAVPPSPAPPIIQKPPQTPTQPMNANANKMLEDHEEPHIELKQGVARTAPPPMNLPGAMPPPPPKPTVSAPPAPAPVSRPPYSADPYREPVDEPTP
jgi:hypothetical protein